jgi:hypothetical protein
MLMADVMSITLSVVGFLLFQQGLWLLSRALWPRRFAATTERARRNPVASFLVGLPVTGVAILLVVVAGKAFGAVGQVAAFTIFVLFWIYANVGVAGFISHIGHRLPSPADEARPWAVTVRGGVVLELSWLPPIIGWPGLLFASIILGAGAMTLSFFKIRQPVPAFSPPADAIRPDPAIEMTSAYTIREPAETLR